MTVGNHDLQQKQAEVSRRAAGLHYLRLNKAGEGRLKASKLIAKGAGKEFGLRVVSALRRQFSLEL